MLRRRRSRFAQRHCKGLRDLGESLVRSTTNPLFLSQRIAKKMSEITEPSASLLDFHLIDFEFELSSLLCGDEYERAQIASVSFEC